jgi:hypothetical protein
MPSGSQDLSVTEPSPPNVHRQRSGLRLLRRFQGLFCLLGLLVLACAMMLRLFVANDSAHVELREDFILLQERGEAKACDALYQQLIQGLAGLDEKSLAEDLARTSLLVDTKNPDKGNLVWKYYISVKKELQKRSEKRLSRILDHPEKQ